MEVMRGLDEEQGWESYTDPLDGRLGSSRRGSRRPDYRSAAATGPGNNGYGFRANFPGPHDGDLDWIDESADSGLMADFDDYCEECCDCEDCQILAATDPDPRVRLQMLIEEEALREALMGDSRGQRMVPSGMDVYDRTGYGSMGYRNTGASSGGGSRGMASHETGPQIRAGATSRRSSSRSTREGRSARDRRGNGRSRRDTGLDRIDEFSSPRFS